MASLATSVTVQLDDILRQREKLKSFDSKTEINAYCDQLEYEITSTAQALSEQIKKNKDELLKVVDCYRKELLLAQQSRPASIKSEFIKALQDMKEISKEIDELNNSWLEIRTSDQAGELFKIQEQAFDLMFRTKNVDYRLKKQIFNENYLKFVRKYSLENVSNHLGKLEFTMAKEDNTEKKTILGLSGHEYHVSRVIFLPNGDLASCSYDGSIKIWNYDKLEMIYELKDHQEWVYSIVFLKNGYLASSSADKTIKIWNLKDRLCVRTLDGHRDGIFSLVILHNGHLASCSWDDTIKIWNLQLIEIEEYDSSCLVSTMKGHGIKDEIVPMGVLSNSFLVTCSDSFGTEKDRDGLIRIWNPVNGSLVKVVSTYSKNARSLLVLSNDTVAIGFEDGTVKTVSLVNESESKVFLLTHEGPVRSLAQLRNGKLLSGGGSSIRVWNTESGTSAGTMPNAHLGDVLSLAVSPDGKLVVSGGSDRMIRLWPVSILSR